MSKANILRILMTLYSSISFGQIRISGKIVNYATQEPIEYANVGIFEKGVGTVCNSVGDFDLIVPNSLLDNSLMISSLGYQTMSLKIGDLKKSLKSLIIELKPLDVLLQEVTILASQQVSLGHMPNGSQVKGFFKATGLGLEGGTFIHNKGKVRLKEFNLNILRIPFDSLKFRVNFYSVYRNNPFRKINSKDIIFTISRADTGHYSLPIMEENIHVIGDFVCSIELIELFGQSVENAEFLFSAIPNNGGFIYKKAISLGRWDKIKMYSLCFWLVGEK